jgi:transposase
MRERAHGAAGQRDRRLRTLANTVAAQRLGVSQQMVCKWRGRFIEKQLNLDEPRPGAPWRVGDEDIEQVIDGRYETSGSGSLSE